MDNRSKLKKIIEYRKAKGSTRKPKYATRKLSIGLVSCLLGYTLLISPVESLAAETSTEIAESEDAGEKPEEEEDKKEEEKTEEEPSGEEQQEETEKEETEKKEEVEEEKEEFHFNDEQRKKLVDEKFDDVKINDLESQARIESEKENFDADKFIDDAINKSKAEKETTETEETASEEGKDAFTDEKSTETNSYKLKSLKQEEEETETLEQGGEDKTPVGAQQGADAQAGQNAEQNNAESEFKETTIEATIETHGIGDKDFNFEGLFGDSNPNLTLTDKKTRKRYTYTINKDTKTITIKDLDGNPIKMEDITNNELSLTFRGRPVNGKLVSVPGSLDGSSLDGKTYYKLELYQAKNTDVVVETQDEEGQKIDKNPTNTDEVNGKKGGLKIGAGGKEYEEEIPENNGGKVSPIRPNQDNLKEINDNQITIEVTGTEEGYLVDKANNKVYKPEVTVTENDLDPSKVVFTEKPLVSDDSKYEGNEERAKVTFDADKYGEIKAGKTYYIIKNVAGKDKLTGPKVTPNKGWEFAGWEEETSNKYGENTQHKAKYKPIPGEGQGIVTKKGEEPKAEDGIKNKDKLPEGTIYTWKEKPDVSEAGEKTGTVVVTYPDGSTQNVAVTVTVKNSIPAETDAEKNPAVAPEKTEVEDKKKLTDDEKKSVEDKVKEKNPEAEKVEVGDDGSVTITYPDDSTNTLTPDQTVTEKPAEDDNKPSNEDSKPTEDDNKPSDEDNKPSDDDKDLESEDDKDDSETTDDSDKDDSSKDDKDSDIKDKDDGSDKDNSDKDNSDKDDSSKDDKGTDSKDTDDDSAKDKGDKDSSDQVADPARGKDDKDSSDQVANPARGQKANDDDIAAARGNREDDKQSPARTSRSNANAAGNNVKTGVESQGIAIATIIASATGLFASRKKKEDEDK